MDLQQCAVREWTLLGTKIVGYYFKLNATPTSQSHTTMSIIKTSMSESCARDAQGNHRYTVHT